MKDVRASLLLFIFGLGLCGAAYAATPGAIQRQDVVGDHVGPAAEAIGRQLLGKGGPRIARTGDLGCYGMCVRSPGETFVTLLTPVARDGATGLCAYDRHVATLRRSKPSGAAAPAAGSDQFEVGGVHREHRFLENEPATDARRATTCPQTWDGFVAPSAADAAAGLALRRSLARYGAEGRTPPGFRCEGVGQMEDRCREPEKTLALVLGLPLAEVRLKPAGQGGDGGLALVGFYPATSRMGGLWVWELTRQAGSDGAEPQIVLRLAMTIPS